MLRRWSGLTDHIPVHDLVDRIFNEGDILKRYIATAPHHLKQRIEANLTRFIELALEMDNGRYPSLSRFVHQLTILRKQPADAPDEPPTADAQRVRVMTIHAAKGLEASVVFLADAARADNYSSAYQALVDWPVEATRPQGFYLFRRKSDADRATRAQMETSQNERAREQANLLFVALTRATQVLFVSGCEPKRGGRGWYGITEQGLRAAEGRVAGLQVEHITGIDGQSVFNTCGWIIKGRLPPPVPVQTVDPSVTSAPIDPALSQPLAAPLPRPTHPKYGARARFLGYLGCG